jgi:hypothetical protein
MKSSGRLGKVTPLGPKGCAGIFLREWEKRGMPRRGRIARFLWRRMLGQKSPSQHRKGCVLLVSVDPAPPDGTLSSGRKTGAEGFRILFRTQAGEVLLLEKLGAVVILRRAF